MIGIIMIHVIQVSHVSRSLFSALGDPSQNHQVNAAAINTLLHLMRRLEYAPSAGFHDNHTLWDAATLTGTFKYHMYFSSRIIPLLLLLIQL